MSSIASPLNSKNSPATHICTNRIKLEITTKHTLSIHELDHTFDFLCSTFLDHQTNKTYQTPNSHLDKNSPSRRSKEAISFKVSNPFSTVRIILQTR